MTLLNDWSQNFPLRGGRARLIFPFVLLVVLLPALAILLRPVPHVLALAEHGSDGYVYVLNNNVTGTNSITVFARNEDGSLSLLRTTSIGGLGSVTAFADGTQGSLIITHEERMRLFAVDAGSNQISVLNVQDGHLSLRGVN